LLLALGRDRSRFPQHLCGRLLHRPLEIKRIREAAAGAHPFAKPNGGGEREHAAAWLKVRVGDHFRHRQQAAGFECFEYFRKRRFPVMDFPEHGDEDGAIERTEVQFAVSDCDLHKVDIGETGPLGCGLRADEHSGLEVERDNAAGRPDLLRYWNGQPARSAADIEHAHSRPELKVREDRLCLGAFEQRIVALDKPGEPCGAGQRVPARQQAPYEEDSDQPATNNAVVMFDAYRSRSIRFSSSWRNLRRDFSRAREPDVNRLASCHCPIRRLRR